MSTSQETGRHQAREAMAVNFDPNVHIHPINLLRSESERIACWYGKKDMKRLDAEVRTEIALFRLVRSNSIASKFAPINAMLPTTTRNKQARRCLRIKRKLIVPVANSVVDPRPLEDVSWTRRGLEHVASLRDLRKRQDTRMALTTCVLVEQDRQRQQPQGGTVDVSILANVSAFFSREAQTRALQRAQADEAFVARTIKTQTQVNRTREETSVVLKRRFSLKRDDILHKEEETRRKQAEVKEVVRGVLQSVRIRKTMSSGNERQDANENPKGNYMKPK